MTDSSADSAPETPAKPPSRRRWGLLLLVAFVAAGVTFAAAALLMDVFEKKQEAQNPFFRVVEIDDRTTDPAVWGKNFPLQYDAYRRTTDMVETKYGGSEAIPRDPTPDDPRTTTSQSKLTHLPELKRMWAGYAFAQDFREERGHAYMLADQIFTERQDVAPQPGTCLHCHASTYTTYLELGDGDIFDGFEKLNQMPYDEAVEHVQHPVACIDCHDPETMQLRVTRPAFMEGIQTLKAQQGVEEYDVNQDATHQELRTYVCAQCHVEYYFRGEEKRLVYPWGNGRRVEEIYAYYQEADFADWTHAETGARMLKAQHPEFEMWSQGIHSRAGVSCADCHMPYERVGATKISDHHVRSPLLNVNRACQTCHHVSEDELRGRAQAIQDRTVRLRDRALEALVELIDDVAAAREGGASDEGLAAAREFQRRASFYVDFVEAENSAGFHADQEATRILGEAIDFVRQGQLAIRDRPSEGKREAGSDEDASR